MQGRTGTEIFRTGTTALSLAQPQAVKVAGLPGLRDGENCALIKLALRSERTEAMKVAFFEVVDSGCFLGLEPGKYND